MTADPCLRVSEDGQRLVVEVIEKDEAWVCVGPSMSLPYLGQDGRDLAYEIFDRAGTSGRVDRDFIAELLSRMEQVTVDKLYAAPATGKDGARARVVLTWAALVVQRLVERVELDSDHGIETRLNQLVSISGSESIDPLRIADIPTVIPDGDLREFRGQSRIATQVRMYLRRGRRLRQLRLIQDEIAAAVYDQPPPARRRVIADRLTTAIDEVRADDAVVGDRSLERFEVARDALARGDLPDEDASPVREIELHPFRNRWALFYEIASGIAFTTFSSAGSFVFLGTRLEKCTGVCQAGGVAGFSASLDIIALVICSFGFLFATLAYANGTGVLARFSTMGYTDSVERGNRVSEYFGVYPLIFAIPLAVEQSTSSPIPFIVKVVGLVSFFGYHWSPGFCLLERVISDEALGTDRKRRVVVAALLILLGLVWFGPSLVEGTTGLWLRLVASAGFLVALCCIYLLASIVPEQGRPSRYRVHRDDVISDESPSLADVRPSGRL